MVFELTLYGHIEEIQNVPGHCIGQVILQQLTCPPHVMKGTF